MWNNYYDKVQYEEKEKQLDDYGNIVYKPARTINVREVAGGNKFVVNDNETTTKYNKEYHIPFEVNEGDKIDGRIVIYVDNNKDVFGNFHFCIVGVE